MVTCLCSAGVLGSVVGAADAQHILCAVVELREAIELAPVVVDGRLVHPAEGGPGVIGAVQEGLQNLPTPVKVSGASQVEPRRTHFILKVCGQTRVQQRSLRRLTNMLT